MKLLKVLTISVISLLSITSGYAVVIYCPEKVVCTETNSIISCKTTSASSQWHLAGINGYQDTGTFSLIGAYYATFPQNLASCLYGFKEMTVVMNSNNYARMQPATHAPGNIWEPADSGLRNCGNNGGNKITPAQCPYIEK